MNYRKIFSEKLVFLRESTGITQQQLADELGITRQSLSLYEKSERTINIELLAKIADFFNVSTDYLMGRTDTATLDENIQTACKVTGLSEKAVENLNNINNLYAPIVIGFIDELICDFDHENKNGVLEGIFKYLIFNNQLLGKVDFEFKCIDDDTLNLILVKQELDNSKIEILSGMIDKILVENIESDLNKIRSKILEKFKGEI